MYNIFNTKTKKRQYLEEGEPPSKKLVSDHDLLVKKLAEKQLQTNLSLNEQLKSEKKFQTSENFTLVPSYLNGVKDLETFKLEVETLNKVNRLKSYNLSSEDIKLFQDFQNLTKDELVVVYNNISEDVLYEKIKGIEEIIHQRNHQKKKNSEELLNKSQEMISMPIDALPGLEHSFMFTISEYSNVDVKKIRKKARSFHKKLNRSVESDKSTISSLNLTDKPTSSKSLWDHQTKIEVSPSAQVIEKDKKYTCKTQNWYTVKDGKIVNIIGSNYSPKTTPTADVNNKLSIEEIKKNVRFKNYEPGQPSKVLFLKNLPKNVNKSTFEDILSDFSKDSYNIKIMNGKMKGQCFIEFNSVKDSQKGLELLNGVLLNDKPIVVQFGRTKT